MSKKSASIGDWAVFPPSYNVEEETSIIPSYNPYKRLYQTPSQTVTGGFTYGIAAVGNFATMGMNVPGGPDSIVFYDPQNDIVKQFPLSFDRSIGGVAGVGQYAVFEIVDYSVSKRIAYCFDPVNEGGFELNYTGDYDPQSSPNPFGGTATVGDWAVFAPTFSPQIIAVNPYFQSVQQVTHGQPQISADNGTLGPYFFAGPSVVGDWAVMAGRTGNVICYNPSQNDLYVHTEEIPEKELTPGEADDAAFISRFAPPTTVGEWAVFPPLYGTTILAFNPITRIQQTLDFDPAEFGSYDPRLLSAPQSNNWFADAATLELNVTGELKKFAIFSPSEASAPLAYDPEENVYHKFNNGFPVVYGASANVNEECIVQYPSRGDADKGSTDDARYFATIKATVSNNYSNSGSDIVFEINEDGTAYVLTSCGTEYNGSLDIPSTHLDTLQSEDTLPVTSIASCAFKDCIALTSVVIPDSVTSIGIALFKDCIALTTVDMGDGITTIPLYTFQGCSSLESIVTPNSLTRIRAFAFENCISLESIENIIGNISSIEDSTFENCILLTSVVIPNSITSIGDAAFRDCLFLRRVTIPDSVTSIGEAAFERTGLTEVVIPEGVTEIACRLFNECVSLDDVSLPDSLTSIESGSFRLCTSLNSITIPDNVTAIETYAFNNCINLISINLSEELISIGNNAFQSCTSLINITLPDGVTEIGSSAFKSCSSLINIDLSEDLETIGNNAFENCTSLSSITIPDSVTSIGISAFDQCSSLGSITCLATSAPVLSNKIPYPDWQGILTTTITVPLNTIVSYQNAGNGTTYAGLDINESIDASNVGLTFTLNDDGTEYSVTNCPTFASGTIDVPSTHLDTSQSPDELPVTSIGYNAFENCQSLTSITLPDSVASIGIRAFYNCKNATSITIGSSSNLTSIGNSAFTNCSSLTSINIPDAVTLIENATFHNCTSLTNVTIPDNVTSIGDIAFFLCTSLTSITIPDGVTSIGTSAFRSCFSASSIILPDSVTSIDAFAFSYCTSLTSITIPDSVTSIAIGVFSSCTSLTSVTIPDSVTSIGQGAFNGCSSLPSIILPDSVTSIGNTAFGGNTSLTSITIPDSVTSIGEGAFTRCSSLTSITIPDGVTLIEQETFYGCSSLTSITIPSSVTNIGFAALRYLDSVTLINFEGTTAPVLEIDFEGTTSYLVGPFGRIESPDVSGQFASVPSGAFSSYISPANGGDGVSKYGGLGVRTLASVASLTFTLRGDGTYRVADCIETAFGTLDIPSTYNGLAVTAIGTAAFQNCTFLSSITIPDSVTSIGTNAFWECDGLTSITIPDSVTSIEDGTFRFCSNLVSVTLPNTLTTIKRDAFNTCTSLPSITIPDSVTAIGKSAFNRCISLTDITIGSGVTSIGDFAFFRCSKLTDITIPDNVTSIGYRVFFGCDNLLIVRFEGDAPTFATHEYYDPGNVQITSAIFETDPIRTTGATSYSGKVTYDSFKSGWGIHIALDSNNNAYYKNHTPSNLYIPIFDINNSVEFTSIRTNNNHDFTPFYDDDTIAIISTINTPIHSTNSSINYNDSQTVVEFINSEAIGGQQYGRAIVTAKSTGSLAGYNLRIRYYWYDPSKSPPSFVQGGNISAIASIDGDALVTADQTNPTPGGGTAIRDRIGFSVRAWKEAKPATP